MKAIMRLVKKVIAWVLTLKIARAFLRYSEHRGPQLADSVTYRTLFSVFAGVLLGFSLAALWLSDNPEIMDAIIDAVGQAIPGLVGEDGIVNPESIDEPAGLSIASIVSTVSLVLAAIGAISSLRLAILLIADKPTTDLAYIWVLLRNLALALFIGAALGASAVATVIGTASIDLITDWLGIPSRSPLVDISTRGVVIVTTFLLNTIVIAVLFRVLSSTRTPWRALWSGAALGGFGLLVLQQLSGLFVGGATSNPLLASFASLIALLLWLNLSAQVILIASSYIVVGIREHEDPIRTKHGASTFAQRKVQQAEIAVQVATDALVAAREAEAEEREKELADAAEQRESDDRKEATP